MGIKTILLKELRIATQILLFTVYFLVLIDLKEAIELIFIDLISRKELIFIDLISRKELIFIDLISRHDNKMKFRRRESF